MLTTEELLYFGLTLIVLWTYPLVKIARKKSKVLLLNFILQLLYSVFYLWLMENYGSKGSSLLWIFYWFITTVIHLIGLNIWTLSLTKK